MFAKIKSWWRNRRWLKLHKTALLETPFFVIYRSRKISIELWGDPKNWRWNAKFFCGRGTWRREIGPLTIYHFSV